MTTRWTPPPLADPGMAVVLGTRPSQVLSGVCRGLSNAEIGAELYLAPDTVKYWIRCLLRWFGADNRTHLAALACSGQVSVLIRLDAWSA
jgi:DNA-binding NarL/FixJ family response regulator